MDLIVKSLLSVEPVVSARTQMTAPHSSNCFELYGFDVLVDADLKPWLLEVNLSPSMQAESPLDWTIKSALLSDALNLVGIDKVDRQTVIRASRSRSEVKRPSYGSGKSGQRPSQVPSHEEEAKVHVGGEQPNAADFRLLEQGQLKTVARALNEMTRVQNFITLFPTEKTVPRYAPITELQLAMKPWPRGRRPAVERPSCSQVMAALLFEHRPSSSSQATGVASRRPRSTSSRPASARPELPARGGDEDADEEAATPASSSGLRLELARTSKDLIRSKRDARARALAMATYPQLAQAATQAGESTRTRRSTRQSPANTVLQQKGCRLMLMEYLIRLDNMCCQLGALELATKIEQIPGLRLGRLQAFQRRLDARHPSQNLAEAESGNFACCIERLLTACRANLLQLVQEVRADAEPGETCPPSPRSGDCGLPLAQQLPSSVLSRPEGREALEELATMSATELEQILLGRECEPEVRLMLEPYAAARRSMSRLAAGSTQAMLRASRPSAGYMHTSIVGDAGSSQLKRTASGPLSELLCIPLAIAAAEHRKEQASMPKTPSRTPSKPVQEGFQASASTSRLDLNESGASAEMTALAAAQHADMTHQPPEASQAATRVGSRPSSGRPPSGSGLSFSRSVSRQASFSSATGGYGRQPHLQQACLCIFGRLIGLCEQLSASISGLPAVYSHHCHRHCCREDRISCPSSDEAGDNDQRPREAPAGATGTREERLLCDPASRKGAMLQQATDKLPVHGTGNGALVCKSLVCKY
ncbi:unnamed protein product [Polarella glacialis]|uniref:Tubulin--tyrosine ligase-like protein 5 n=1 Tax=Polarella glacialis TaxID=89957 RepID=A0A813LDS0_POLGL|nr:unnamed protein product [Polarella glacialis]